MMVDWKAEVDRRVGGYLQVENISRLLMVVPGASGDIALATTAVREIKKQNASCKITFAVRNHLQNFAKLCPGVSEVIHIPFEEQWPQRSLYLRHYKYYADDVVSVGVYEEQMDLLINLRLTLVDTIWLLSGLRRPTQPLKIWLKCGEDQDGNFTEGASPQFLQAPQKGSPFFFGGWQWDARKDVILSTSALSLDSMPINTALGLISTLVGAGFAVHHNIRKGEYALPSTIPLVCSHHDFLWLRMRGIRFIGSRSGLCDIAAASSAPMMVISQAFHPGYGSLEQLFGFKFMNIDCSCHEVFLDQSEFVQPEKVLGFMGGAIT